MNQLDRKIDANSNDIKKSKKLTKGQKKPISEDESIELSKKKLKSTERKPNRNQKRKRKLSSSSNEESSASDEETFRGRCRSNPHRTTRVCYKNYSEDSDSTKDTSDADDEYQLPTSAAAVPEPEVRVIDKVMAQRRGKFGVVGPSTTIYAVEEDGDPNEGCDPNDLAKTEIQFLIKWKGYSHLHSTWESEASLKAQKVDTRSMKKIQDFFNKEEDIADLGKRVSSEDSEYFECEQQLQQCLIESYYTVERIIATNDADNQESYLVKWQSLPYAEATWEDAELIERKWPDRTREFHERENSTKTPSKMCKALKYRPKFNLLTSQPAYLADGNADFNLRDYQLHGVNWLLHAWCKESSVILADEMGLGKTIQIISFLHYLFHEHEVHGPFLVVVPLSTMTSWQQEFSLWAPDMNVVTYIGDMTSRKLIREHEWCFGNTNRPKFNVILTTYEILIKDKAVLGGIRWAELMVDEAHRLKNDNSLLYRVLSEFFSHHRVLITGTPLQNVLKELWALLHFIMPSKFASWEEFEEDHDADAADQGFISLHKQLEPFLLRRVKKDVEKSLPAKVEQILRVEMTLNQKKFYRWILTKNFKALRKESKGSTTSFLNVIMQLKKCCNHSFLIDQPDSEVTHKASAEEQLQELIRGSGKLVLLDKLLTRLRETGHRVLIFSQMVRMLDILAEYLEARRFPFQRLDGSSKSELRKLALDHFNAENSQDFCFLLSTRAGGLGINLATADTVIIFDSDWNPQNDLQAQARAHRIGQKRQVNIYRLVTKNSVEEEIVERAKKKMVLDHLIIQRMDTTGRTVLDSKSTGSAAVPFNKEELTAILKFGAAELFKNDDLGDEEPVCDIDEILRRAETREEEAPATMGDELLSAFKMANFVMTEEEYKPPRENEHEDHSNEDWDEIIPKNFRARLEEEENAKELADSYLPPKRIRRTVQNINKFDSDDLDESDDGAKEDANVSVASVNSADAYSSTDDESDDEDSNVPRMRGKAPISNRLPYESFTSNEIRSFVESFKKFPAPMTRLEAIARDAKLQYKWIADLHKLGEYMYERCVTLMNEIHAKETSGSEKIGVPMCPSFKMGSVTVNAKKVSHAAKFLEPLGKVLPVNDAERSSWILKARVKCGVRYSDVDWNIEDDSKLLRGIFEYGMGSWEAIKNDPSFSLGEKILRPEGKQPGPKELKNRALYLMKILREEISRNGPTRSALETVPINKNEIIEP